MDRSLSYRANAFTLIEILVALTIIGVLLSFVAPMVLSRPDQARNLKIENDFFSVGQPLSYPFNIEGERRSFSFNVKIVFKK